VSLRIHKINRAGQRTTSSELCVDPWNSAVTRGFVVKAVFVERTVWGSVCRQAKYHKYWNWVRGQGWAHKVCKAGLEAAWWGKMAEIEFSGTLLWSLLGCLTLWMEMDLAYNFSFLYFSLYCVELYVFKEPKSQQCVGCVMMGILGCRVDKTGDQQFVNYINLF
jgi:hypothetical protein